MNVMETIIEKLAKAVLTIAGALLVLVTICMLTVIAGRYAGFATAWADEVARIAFVWCASLGAASGIQKGLHFVVFQASTIENNTTKRILQSISVLIMLSLCLVLAWSTTQSIPVAAMSILPAIGVSNAWFHFAVTTFAVLSTIFLTARLVLLWQRPSK